MTKKPEQWLSIIKLFELEVSVHMMAGQVKMSYEAGAVNIIRMNILSHADDAGDLLGGEIEPDEACFGGRRKGNRGRGASGKVYINGTEGFQNWAKERFIKHHGVSKEYFPLYLKELEFRYHNRDSDIFDLVVDPICDLVPNRDSLSES